MHGHAERCAELVRRPCTVGRRVGVAAQDLGPCTESRQLLRDRRGHRHPNLGGAVRGSVPGVDHDDLAIDRATHPAQLLALSHDGSARHVFEGPHPLDGRDRVQPHHAVGFLADVALELAHRQVGPLAVDPVLLAGVEPERVELALQFADVVSSERRRVHVQRSVTEPEPCFDELHPRVRAHQAIDPEVAEVLERADGGFRRGSEPPRQLTRCQGVPEGRQPLLDVQDLGPLVAATEDAHATSLRLDRVPRKRGGVRRGFTGAARDPGGSRPSASHR